MKRQYLKLLLILNVCWWLGASFALFRYADHWPAVLVSTVLALASLALVGNLLYWLAWLKKKNEAGGPNNKASHVFILLSTLLQIISLLFLTFQ
jgi:hypothetical protein